MFFSRFDIFHIPQNFLRNPIEASSLSSGLSPCDFRPMQSTPLRSSLSAQMAMQCPSFVSFAQPQCLDRFFFLHFTNHPLRSGALTLACIANDICRRISCRSHWHFWDQFSDRLQFHLRICRTYRSASVIVEPVQLLFVCPEEMGKQAIANHVHAVIVFFDRLILTTFLGFLVPDVAGELLN